MNSFFAIWQIWLGGILAVFPQFAPEKHDLAADAERMLRMVEKESPVLYREIDRADRVKTLQKMMDSFGVGVEAVSEKEHTDKPGRNQLRPPMTAKLIFSNTIFYARLDRLEADSLRQLSEDMTASARLANKPFGAILDLREANGFSDYQFVNAFLALFHGPKDGREQPYFHTVPVVVLCCAHTSGPPELLALLLEHTKHGITMGQAGAGNIFPKKTVTCAGKKWRVPQIDDPAWNFPPEAHKPLIVFDPHPRIPYEKIGTTDLSRADDAIRRAGDLLRSLRAVSGLLK